MSAKALQTREAEDAAICLLGDKETVQSGHSNAVAAGSCGKQSAGRKAGRQTIWTRQAHGVVILDHGILIEVAALTNVRSCGGAELRAEARRAERGADDRARSADPTRQTLRHSRHIRV